MKYFLFLLLNIVTIPDVDAQSARYFDPGQAFLRMAIEKGGIETFQRMGNYKVLGTSFLFGPGQVGDIYFKNGHAKNVFVSYDTYKQLLAVNTDDAGKALVKQLNDLDSFTLKATNNSVFKIDLHFINASQLDATQKAFFQKVVTGPRFNLYKAYKSDFGYVQSEQLNTEYRQFELLVEYFYTDIKTPGLKKLKTASNAVKKEFKNIKDVSAIADHEDYDKALELNLIKVFEVINH